MGKPKKYGMKKLEFQTRKSHRLCCCSLYATSVPVFRIPVCALHKQEHHNNWSQDDEKMMFISDTNMDININC